MNNTKLSDRPITLHLTNALGHHAEISFTGLNNVMDILRQTSTAGWRCGNIPVGGVNMPVRMFPVFDWRLLGCEKPFILGNGNDDDEKLAVRHAGYLYKHRWMPAQPTRLKLPARLWFSRGAKSSEGEKDKDSPEPEYVPLISFGGGGRIIPSLCEPDSVDERGNILRVVNSLPGKDGEDFGRYLQKLEDERQAASSRRSAGALNAAD